MRQCRGDRAPFRERVLASIISVITPLEALGGLFPPLREHYIRELAFELCYHIRGSGLNFTYQDVTQMSLDEAHWFLEKLNEAREKEAQAMKNAQKKK